MTHHANGIVAGEEPPPANNNSTDNRSHSEPSSSDDVEVRHRGGRVSRLLSMLSCLFSRSSIEKSVHFHANQVEDSVHVMIKHDKEACKKRGVADSHYTPRAPLSERLAQIESARKMVVVSAQEEDDTTDILAAVTKADCCQ